jgi:hypothetical protein
MMSDTFGREGNNVVPSGLGEWGSCPVVETTGYTTFPLRGIEYRQRRLCGRAQGPAPYNSTTINSLVGEPPCGLPLVLKPEMA